MTTLVCMWGVVMTALGEQHGMAAKKATIQSKKVSLPIGSQSKVVIKNRKKGATYIFKSSDKKRLKVSNKGVMKSLKVGKVKVTVTEKFKKKSRKVGVVTVTIRGKEAVITPPTETIIATPTVVPTTVPTIAPTLVPTVAPTMEPTAVPTEDVYKTELFTLTTTETKTESVEGASCTVEMVYFNGSAEGEYFSGSVYKESSNTVKTYADGTRQESARYILSGKDANGNPTMIFIEDNSGQRPIILTNSESLRWIETADLQSRVVNSADGGRTIKFMWNEANEEPISPPEVVYPDNSLSYTEEIFTFSINIGASDSVSGGIGDATMIHFGGSANCDRFKGNIVADSVDTRLKFSGQVETLSARYILEGVDDDGNECRIYVENNGVDDKGMVTQPVIITDNPKFAWIESAPLHGTTSWGSTLQIHMWTTADAVQIGSAHV